MMDEDRLGWTQRLLYRRCQAGWQAIHDLGETGIQVDLFAAADKPTAEVLIEAENVQLTDVTTDRLFQVWFEQRGETGP